MKLLLATRSAHKAGEIREILADVPHLELLDLNDAGLPETPEEEGIEVFMAEPVGGDLRVIDARWRDRAWLCSGGRL